jgi:hypothetical protein
MSWVTVASAVFAAFAAGASWASARLSRRAQRGARNPSFAVLVRLAVGLGVTVSELGRAYDEAAAAD